MYQNGQAEKAYNYLLYLTDPTTSRREYPEVSFGVIKGFAEGLMGVEADARLDQVTTLYRGKATTTSELKDLPLLKTFITIKHEGNEVTTLTNSGKKKILWKPEFLDNGGKAIAKKAVWVKPGNSLTAVNNQY